MIDYVKEYLPLTTNYFMSTSYQEQVGVLSCIFVQKVLEEQNASKTFTALNRQAWVSAEGCE
jgi:hypothetical protein